MSNMRRLVAAREAVEEQMADDGDGQWVDKLLDAYAHELAEKIRNSERLRDYTDDHMSDCNMAADLIDPEIE